MSSISQPISYQPIYDIILLPPPIETPITEPVTKTPKVSKTQLQQQQQK